MTPGRDTTSADASAAAAAAAQKAVPAGRRPRWGLRIASALALTITVALLGLATVLFLGIEGNPMVARLVRERIVLALQERIDPALRLTIGAVDLKRQAEGTAVRVTDFIVKGPDGRTLVSAPSGLVIVDTPSLFVLRLLPTEVVLDGLRVAVEISETGSLTVASQLEEGNSTGQTPDSGEAAPLERLQQVIGAAFAGLAATRDTVGGALPALGISNANLVIQDRRTGRRFSVRDIEGRLLSSPDGGATARVALKTGAKPFAVTLAISPRTEAGQTFTARSDRLTLGDVLALSGVPAKDVDGSAVVDLGLVAKVDHALKPLAAEADLAVDRLAFRHPKLAPDATRLQDIRLKLAWRDGENRIEIAGAEAQSGATRVRLTGSAEPPKQRQEPWAIALEGRDLKIEGLGREDPAFDLGRVTALFHAWPEAARLDIARFEATGPKAQVSLTGQLAADHSGRPEMRLDVAAQDVDARVALRLWPVFAASEVRSWLADHLKQGHLNRFSLKMALDADGVPALFDDSPLANEAVAVSWHVSRATLQPLAGAPAILNATASGTATGRTVRMDISGGHVDVGKGRRIQVSDGSLIGADSSKHPTDARVRLRFAGPAEAVAEFIRAPAIRSHAGVAIDPAGIKGTMEGEATIGLRLSDAMGPKDVHVGVKAAIKGLSVEKAIGNDRIEAGNFQLSVDQDLILLKGDAKVFGAPAAIEVRASAKMKPRATMALVLDDAARARKGYALGGAITGPVGLKVSADLDSATDSETLIEVDFTRTRIDGLLPGWSKSAGQTGRAKAILASLPAGGWKLDGLEVDSGALSVRGSAQFATDGQFIKALLPAFRLSQGDNARVDIDRAGGVTRITVKGNSVDARPYLRALQTGAIDKTGAKDLEVSLRSTALTGFNAEALADAGFSLVVRGGDMKRLDLSGRFDKGPVAAQLALNPGTSPTLTVVSDDAGAFLRFFDIYNRMQGGQLTMGATLSRGGQVGTILVKEFILRNEPAMKRLVADAAAQASGDIARINPELVRRLSTNQDVKFSKVTVEFARNAGLLAIKDAVIWGPEVGGNIAGYLDYARDKVELTGTFVPAYAVNNFFSQVPVFGPLLGGGRNEGLFAVRYGIVGKVSAPTLTINPLTAIAPGFLRKIIDFQGGRSNSGAPSRQPPAEIGR